MRKFFLYLFFFANLSAAELKHTRPDGGKFEFDLPAAPLNFAEFKKLQIPSDDEYQLDFGAQPKVGHYTGPDGGLVYLWKKDTWQWLRKDGKQVNYFSKDNWAVKKDGATIWISGKACPRCKSNLEYTFADGSKLHRKQGPTMQTPELYYENPATQTFFSFIQPRLWASEYEDHGLFELHFPKDQAVFAHSFVAYPKKNEFLARASGEFGLVTPKKIPILFFPDAQRFSRFRGKNVGCAGGSGGIYGITFCGVQNKLYAHESDDATLRQAQWQVQPVGLFLHEITHNMQQLTCRLQREGKPYVDARPINWFVEGHAEFVMFEIEKRDKAYQHGRFLDQFIAKNKMPDLDRDDPYIVGSMALQYISETQGNTKIRDFLSGWCNGETEANLLRTYFNTDKKALAENTYRHFAAREKALRTAMLSWWTDWSVGLTRSSSGYSSADKAETYLLDVSAYAGKVEGVFHDPDMNKVHLFADGTYVIENPGFRAEFFPNGTSHFVRTPP